MDREYQNGIENFCYKENIQAKPSKHFRPTSLSIVTITPENLVTKSMHCDLNFIEDFVVLLRNGLKITNEVFIFSMINQFFSL